MLLTNKAAMYRTLVTLITPMLLIAGCDSSDRSRSGPLTTEVSIAVMSNECAFGGVQKRIGFDMNNNGSVEDGELNVAQNQCNDSTSSDVDDVLRALITDLGLTAAPEIGRTIPTVNDPLAQLGKALFFTKGLGGDQDSACVTCHHPFLGGSDDKALPVGVAAENHDLLGVGRNHANTAVGFDGGPTVPRNAPTTFNIALWDNVLFHDGRIESLTKVAGTNGADGQIRTPDVGFGLVDPGAGSSLTEAQVRFPVTSPEEMRGFVFEAGNTNDDVRNHLAARLRNDMPELAVNDWLSAFRDGFSNPTGTAAELITYDNIARAIAAYEASQTFVDNPFRRYVDGDDTAMSGEAKLGAMLFYGDAGCAACHSGPAMTDESFHVIAAPQIGRGKGNDNGVNTDDDFGRFRETGVAEDRYAFRTPSMLNVAKTAPFTHAGAYRELEAVVRHHLDPRSAVQNYDFTQLEPGTQVANMQANTAFALDQLDSLRANGQSLLPQVTLSDDEVSWVVTFLEHLTDYCLDDAQCIGQWVPSAADPNPDALRIEAVDQNGDPLTP